MANITAKDVANLRAQTGLGMMECKKALVEANGGSTTLDYKKIRERASMLWSDLVARDEDNAAIILKKVEMIFGRPIKLSEITEDQVDLFNLVLLDMRDLAAER